MSTSSWAAGYRNSFEASWSDTAGGNEAGGGIFQDRRAERLLFYLSLSPKLKFKFNLN